MSPAARRELLCDLVLGVPALALYVATLAPGLYTLDRVELAAGAYGLGIVHATGYPVYLLLLKAAPFWSWASAWRRKVRAWATKTSASLCWARAGTR